MALRFSEDSISPRPRMLALWQELRGQMKVIEILSGAKSGRYPISANAHAVLTESLAPETEPDHPTRQALASVLDFFSQSLANPKPPPAPLPACDWTALNH